MKPLTPLDEALKAAMADRAQGNFFYDCFLNTDIYVPVQADDKSEPNWRCLGIKDRFFPLFLKFENGRCVPVFDTLEKLQTWASSKVLDYIVIRGHLFLGVIDPSLYVMINLGTDYNYTLTPDILEKLRSNMTTVQSN